jgi:putative ribosome biogenesis GTPase RsgA
VDFVNGPYSFKKSFEMDFNAPNDYFELECDTSKIPIPTQGPLNLPDGCNKFRILLTGRSGVGKSTLVSAVFGITPRAVSGNDCALLFDT